jgi:anti-anti-sigma factor
MTDQAASSRLTLDIERTGDLVVVRCHGKLIAGETNPFYVKVSQLAPGTKRMVLDLTDLAMIDSMGMGTLVRLYVSAKSSGCTVELVNLGAPIRKLFVSLNLLSVFTIIGENDIRIH